MNKFCKDAPYIVQNVVEQSLLVFEDFVFFIVEQGKSAMKLFFGINVLSFHFNLGLNQVLNCG